MKRYKYIWLCLCYAATLCGCKDDSILRYDEAMDSVYFESSAPTGTIPVDEVNFAGRVVKTDDTTLAGDSIRTVTVKLILRVMGWEADRDRQVTLRVRQATADDSRTLANLEIAGAADLEMQQQAVIRRGKLRDTLVVTINRPALRQAYYASMVEIDPEQKTQDFALGPEEGLKHLFVVTDRYEKPDYWKELHDYYYGQYSPEKHAFMVTVLKTTDFESTRSARTNKILLNAALKKYNAEHPNHPKDFTFDPYIAS